MNEVDIPFKLIISLIVVRCFQAKKSRGAETKPKQQTRRSDTQGLGSRHTKCTMEGGGGKVYLKNGGMEEWKDEGKTKSTRNVVEEERLCCTGGNFVVDPFVGSRQVI